MSNNEDKILNGLIYSDEYFASVFSYLKADYFQEIVQRKIFTVFKKIVEEKDARPTYDGLEMVIENDIKIAAEDKKALKKYIDDFRKIRFDVDEKILIAETEKWAKLNAFKNGMAKSIDIIKKSGSNENFQQAMSILEDSYNISFERDGYAMSFNDEDDRKRRFAMLQEENIIKCGFNPLDDLVGGFKPKTLNVFQAPTNQGKTLTLTFLAAQFIMQGYDVAYVTLEVAAEEILARIDANLLNVSTYDLSHLDGGEEMFIKLFRKVDEQNPGRLEVKQFAGATWLDIKLWLKKKSLEKKGFRPQILFIDYLGLMKNTSGISDNMYQKLQANAEDVRNYLAIEKGLTVFSASQTHRATEGKIRKNQEKTVIGNDDVAESYALPQTCDTYISQFEIQEDISQYMNNDISGVYIWQSTKTRSFIPPGRKAKIGVSKCKQRLIEINTGNIDEKIINNDIETDGYIPDISEDFFDGKNWT